MAWMMLPLGKVGGLSLRAKQKLISINAKCINTDIHNLSPPTQPCQIQWWQLRETCAVPYWSVKLNPRSQMRKTSAGSTVIGRRIAAVWFIEWFSYTSHHSAAITAANLFHSMTTDFHSKLQQTWWYGKTLATWLKWVTWRVSLRAQLGEVWSIMSLMQMLRRFSLVSLQTLSTRVLTAVNLTVTEVA